MRAHAEAQFHRLRLRGILFNDPETAAAATARVYAAADSWWESPRLAHERAEFASHFAQYRKDWPREWARVLLNISPRPAQTAVTGKVLSS